MKVLVTGAAGFLGKSVTETLSKMTADVTGLDIVGGHNILKCDLTNAGETSKTLKGRVFDAVIHLAGIRGSLKEMNRVNVRGTANLLNGFHSPPGCFVLASSCAVYGIPEDVGGCVNENSPTAPITDYGQTMLKKEQVAGEICSTRGIPMTSARIFNLFGARQSPSMMTSAVARKLVKIYSGSVQPPLQTGPLHTRRDLIDSDDAAQALVLMAVEKTAGNFNVGTGIPVSGDEVVNTLQDILETQVPVRINSEFNPMVESIYADISKIQSVLRWKPSVPFRTTLTAIVNYWLKQENARQQFDHSPAQ